MCRSAVGICLLTKNCRFEEGANYIFVLAGHRLPLTSLTNDLGLSVISPFEARNGLAPRIHETAEVPLISASLESE
jgi:hypothetical protein